MEVCDQAVNDLKLIARVNENSRAAFSTLHLHTSSSFIVIRRALHRPRRSRPHGNDPPTFPLGLVDSRCAFLADMIFLKMHGMLFDILAFDRPERADSHVQRHIDQLHALGFRLLQQFICKVQSSRRRRYRAFLLAVHRLIPVFILFLAAPFDVRRQRHASQLFQPFHKQTFILKFH